MKEILQFQNSFGGLPTTLCETVLRLFAKASWISSATLFGSRALGTSKTGSDIDICLFTEDVKNQDFLKLKAELDDLMTPYTFDVILFSEISNEDLKKHIVQHGINIYIKLNIVKT